MLKTGAISMRCVRVATQPFPESLAKSVLPDIDKRYPVIANRHNRAVSGLSMGGGDSTAASRITPGCSDTPACSVPHPLPITSVRHMTSGLRCSRPQYLSCTNLGLRNQRLRCSGSKNMVGSFRSRTLSRRRPVLILAFAEREGADVAQVA